MIPSRIASTLPLSAALCPHEKGFGPAERSRPQPASPSRGVSGAAKLGAVFPPTRDGRRRPGAHNHPALGPAGADPRGHLPCPLLQQGGQSRGLRLPHLRRGGHAPQPGGSGHEALPDPALAGRSCRVPGLRSRGGAALRVLRTAPGPPVSAPVRDHPHLAERSQRPAGRPRGLAGEEQRGGRPAAEHHQYRQLAAGQRPGFRRHALLRGQERGGRRREPLPHGRGELLHAHRRQAHLPLLDPPGPWRAGGEGGVRARPADRPSAGSCAGRRCWERR